MTDETTEQKQSEHEFRSYIISIVRNGYNKPDSETDTSRTFTLINFDNGQVIGRFANEKWTTDEEFAKNFTEEQNQVINDICYVESMSIMHSLETVNRHHIGPLMQVANATIEKMHYDNNK